MPFHKMKEGIQEVRLLVDRLDDDNEPRKQRSRFTFGSSSAGRPKKPIKI